MCADEGGDLRKTGNGEVLCEESVEHAVRHRRLFQSSEMGTQPTAALSTDEILRPRYFRKCSCSSCGHSAASSSSERRAPATPCPVVQASAVARPAAS